MREAARPEHPEQIWTTLPPAKSRSPASIRKPSGAHSLAKVCHPCVRWAQATVVVT